MATSAQQNLMDRLVDSDISEITYHKLRSFPDPARGTLSVAECGYDVPFPVQRMFYLYDCPQGVTRGQHAHKTQKQFLMCPRGSIEVLTIRRGIEQSFLLDKPDGGVYFPPMTWIRFQVITSDAMVFVLCSGLYNEDDYIRNFAEFQAMAAKA